MIRWLTAFLDLPPQDFEPGVAFWRQVTGTTLSAPRGPHGDFATLLPPDGDAFLRVQRVHEGPGGVHVDLHTDDLPALAGRALAHGATEVIQEEGLVVLRSPGGFPFCVVGGPESVRPTPQPGVADQVCLDIPPASYDAETRFWTDVTGWQLRTTGSPEFLRLWRPLGVPVHLLLQRLDDDRAGPVTGHLDLAAGHRAEEVVATHQAWGAQLVRRGDGWVTLRDPVGREYCVTRRDPKAELRPG